MLLPDSRLFNAVRNVKLIYMGNSIKNMVSILSFTFAVLLIPNLLLAHTPQKFPDYITQRVSKMTLDEKVGQLFMVGFPYRELNKDLSNFIQTYKVGSFILFKRNIASIDQIKNLNNDLYKISYTATKLPPLLAVDQEGGAVSRLPIFPKPPNFLSMGQTQDPSISKTYGFEIGKFLSSVGFNMNLAPVLDIVDVEKPSFIGVRSIGSNPETVSVMGKSFSEGLIQSYIIPTAKHFPGTGSSMTDPHKSISKNSESKESIFKTDLVPFLEFIKLKEKTAIMMSHFIYPSLDKNNIPASFSSSIMTDLLRNELGYKGIIITDDLQMEGSKALLETHKAALKSLIAGADMIMLTWSLNEQTKAIEFVKKYLQENPHKISDFDLKVSRILQVKSYVNRNRHKGNSLNFNLMGKLTSPEYQNIENSIFKWNLLNTKNHDVSLRTPSSIPRQCVISNSNELLKSFSKHSKKSSAKTFVIDRSNYKNLKLWTEKNNCSYIIYVPTSARYSDLISSAFPSGVSDIIYVNTGSPLLVKNNEKYLKVIQLSFNYENLGQRLAENIDGIIQDINGYVLN